MLSAEELNSRVDHYVRMSDKERAIECLLRGVMVKMGTYLEQSRSWLSSPPSARRAELYAAMHVAAEQLHQLADLIVAAGPPATGTAQAAAAGVKGPVYAAPDGPKQFDVTFTFACRGTQQTCLRELALVTCAPVIRRENNGDGAIICKLVRSRIVAAQFDPALQGDV